MKRNRVTAKKSAVGGDSSPLRDSLAPKGRVEVFTTIGRPVLTLGREIPYPPAFLAALRPEVIARLPKRHDSHELDFSKTKVLGSQDIHNIIVNGGKDVVIESLTTGFINVVARMAVGDRGTIPSDPTVPKIPVDTQDALFDEVYRDDVDATILDVGTPTTHSAKFIKTFSSLVIPVASFSNQAAPTINEVGLITADLFGSAPLPRAPVAAPDSPDADEALFSIRTFKSVPFEAANEIAVTIRYTIYIE